MTKAISRLSSPLLAALASALGDVVRQRSAQEITDKQVGHLQLFRMSVRDAKWWLGGVGAIANYSAAGRALVLGSVMLVTALQVTALLFRAADLRAHARRRVTRWEWTWAVCWPPRWPWSSRWATRTLALRAGRWAPGSWWRWSWARSLVFCVVAARIWPGVVAAVLLAVVAGSSLALFAVLTKGVVEVAEAVSARCCAHRSSTSGLLRRWPE